MDYKNIDVLNCELAKKQYTIINKNDFPNQIILHQIVLAFHDYIFPLYNNGMAKIFSEYSTTEHYYANYYVDLFHKLYWQCTINQEDTEELDSDNNNYLVKEENNFVVYLESHQNKHQSMAIGKLKTYTGAPGNKFPSMCDLEWHTNNTCPVVLTMMQKAYQEKHLSETERVYIPKKEPINNIIYDVVFCYNPTQKKYFAWYHCYPTDNFKV